MLPPAHLRARGGRCALVEIGGGGDLGVFNTARIPAKPLYLPPFLRCVVFIGKTHERGG